jgi:protein-S-isoprenylcysteine O-methyltransferase Ste14
MQWSDVTKAPPEKMLRQFAGLFLVVFGGLAAWRYFHGQAGVWTDVLAVAAVVVGVSGLIKPALVRPIYSGWMVVAFPIGWTVSHIALGAVFYVVFTFVGLVFRVMGRDVLQLRRGTGGSYWMPKGEARSGDEYMRQF